MRKSTLGLSLLLLLFTFSAFAQDENKYVFTDVNVIDIVGEDILEHQDVYISGEKIERIIPTEKKKSKGYTKISGKEKYLMPGIMDAHAHLPGPQGLEMPMEDYLLLQLANGVTSLRCLRYEEEYLGWKKKVEAGSVLSPNLFVTTPVISIYGDMDYANATELFKSYKSQGYDHVKYMSGLNAATHKSLCRIAKESGLAFVGHLPKYVGLKNALENGQMGIEHFNGYTNYEEEDQEELKSLIQLTAKKGVYNCPTLEWYEITQLYVKNPVEVLNKRNGLEYLPKDLVAEWNNDLETTMEKKASQADEVNPRIELLKLFKDAKAPLLVSPSDGVFIVPGFGMLEEMKLFKKGGLNNWEILQAATVNGSKFYQLENEGEVKADYVANIVLLDENPIEKLENVSLVNGVMVNGKWHAKKELQKELDKIKNR